MIEQNEKNGDFFVLIWLIFAGPFTFLDDSENITPM